MKLSAHKCLLLSLGLSACGSLSFVAPPSRTSAPAGNELSADSVAEASDSLLADTIIRLTEQDYAEVAEELGVDVASVKAVIDIEAGRTHQGFHAPGKPIINFDLTMFRRFAGKRGINLSKYNRSHPAVFARPNVRKYGSQQAAQHVRLAKAREIDDATAIESTFWGMFQIGGFNWRKCGAKSLDDFARRMAMSEREQLELFVQFIKNSGLDKSLRTRDWRAFARGYNGASYARRGYHTRLANSYARHLKLEKEREARIERWEEKGCEE